MLQNSYVIAFIYNLGNWFSNQFENSNIIQTFLSQQDKIAVSQGSIITKLFRFITEVFKSIFRFFKLDKLLDGSIFTMPFLWALPVIAFVPFLPTMVFLALSLVSIAVLLAWLFSKQTNKLKFFGINKYILVYIVVYMYAAFASVARTSSIKVALVTIGLTLFYFVIVNVIDTQKKFHFVMLIFLTVGVIISLYGIYQFLFPANFGGTWVDSKMFENIKMRVYATFDNPNVLGEYLLLTIPFSTAYFFTEKNWIRKLIALGATGIMFLCLLLTYSRGCYLGILIGMGVFLILLDRRFIWLAVLGLILLPFVLPQSIISRFTSIGNLEDSSTSYRLNIWLGTITMLKDYWICGTGPGIDAFNQVYPLYSYNSIAAPHSHNLFLQLMCDAGIVGVGIFIFILYKFFRTTCSALKIEKIKKNRVFIIAGISAILAFSVQSMFDYTFYNYKVVIMFWITLGFGIITTKLSSMKE